MRIHEYIWLMQNIHHIPPEENIDQVIDGVAACFLLLSEPSRLKIMRSICHGEKSVTSIVEETCITQTNVSRHLGLMHRSGMVQRRREGNQIFYRIVDLEMLNICQAVCERVMTKMGMQPLDQEQIPKFFLVKDE